MWTLREKVLVAALISTIIIATVIVLVASFRISNVGRIRSIGVAVYEDPEATELCTTIDWGELDPGDLAGVTVYIKNTKNVNFTLTFNCSLWEPPEAEQFLTLDWNYSGLVLVPEQIIPVQITLYVSLSIHDIDQFSFETCIIGTEH